VDEKAKVVITKYLGDMHALESHGLQAVQRQVNQLKDSGHPDAQAGVVQFKQTLEAHVSALEGRLNALGGSGTHPIKEAVAAAAGVVAGIYNAVRSEEASKSIRDDYTFFSHSSIAYLMLHTTARSLGDEGTAMLAERGYRDMARLVMLIDKVMPQLVIAELTGDSLPAKDVSSDSARLITEAWARP